MKVPTEKIVDGGWGSVVAVVLFIIPLMVRGVHAVNRSRSQQRKEFLEIWEDGRLSGHDLWIELAIRHKNGVRVRFLSRKGTLTPLLRF